MGLLSVALGYDHGGNIKNRRKIKRRAMGAPGWVRLESSFAVRSCKVMDVSNCGACIVLDRSDGLTDEFTLMTSRQQSSGRRARVKWRRGLQIGAEFF
jgi:hypothetical protein